MWRLPAKALSKAACVAVAVITILSGAAIAADWTRYDNARFGYSIELPPGFLPVGESDNGDGGSSRSSDGKAELLVFGAYLVDTSFKLDVANRVAQATDSGWQLSYRRIGGNAARRQAGPGRGRAGCFTLAPS